MVDAAEIFKCAEMALGVAITPWFSHTIRKCKARMSFSLSFMYCCESCDNLRSASRNRPNAAITSLMCGEAYAMSARIAAKKGPFAGYQKNEEPFLGVIRKHRKAAYNVQPESSAGTELFAAQKKA